MKTRTALAQKAKSYREFLTFCVIGGVNTLVHAAIVVLLAGHLSVNQVYANVCGFLAANAASFVLNAMLTFRVPVVFLNYLKFLSSSLVTLGIIVALAAAAEYFHVHYLYALAGLILLSPALNFLILKYFAFR
ncbi:MAG: GtrA family protein [Rhizobiales bacterium]|nr:GtrA family protein [Hyphomicrobiales bacterium]